VFTPFYPGQVGKVILSLALGRENAVARLLVSSQQGRDELCTIDDVVTTYAAYTDAIECVLGAHSRLLVRRDAETVRKWLGFEDARISSRIT
jgi:hypothetical protein